MNKFFFYTLILLPCSAFAQLGGKKSFEFLNVPNNARLSALGGVNVSNTDRDINFLYSNPSLVGDTLTGWASVNYQFYIADIGQSSLSYAHDFKKIGVLAFGVQHMSYGAIKGYDATGLETGDFNSGETAIVISKNHQVNNFRFGANLKAVFSAIAGYRSSALMLDLGGTFIHPKKYMTVGLVMKNVGVVLSEYSQTSSVKLPFDLQVGTTFKPEHMPFRFSITGYNLASKNVTYYNPQQTGAKNPGTFDKILRRFNFATEILIHKNIDLLVAYNYRVHQELKLSAGGGGAGIAFGFAARIKAVEFIFSRGGYVAGNAGYCFTLSMNTQKILKRA